ncbi:MSTO1 protein, partial [Polypterus senegalus]
MRLGLARLQDQAVSNESARSLCEELANLGVTADPHSAQLDDNSGLYQELRRTDIKQHVYVKMSNPCREVITLQLGHYANFVGSHWWNLQDASLCYDASPEETPSEIFSDVLFRVGQTHSGQTTYTPRLIAFDLKGSLNTLRQEGCLYETSSESNSLAWEGAVMTHMEEPAQKNEFLQDLELLDVRGGKYMFPNSSLSVPNTVNGQLEHGRKAYNLESSVRVWSDFLRVHLHPKTISIVNQYSYEGECDRLEAFGQGESLLKENSFLDDLEDKLHFFVEECDYLQGFQVLCDIQDGFSGLGSSVTELLHDEYGGRGIFTLGLAPVSHPQSSIVKDVYHLINSVLSFVHLSNNSSSFCPLSLRGGLERRPSPHTTFPYLLYDVSIASSWYHSSAVLATVLDTLTLPYRLHNGGCSMGHLIDALVFSGRKVLCASASVPFPMVSDKSLPDTLVDFGETLPWRPVSACGELRENRCFAQSHYMLYHGQPEGCVARRINPSDRPAPCKELEFFFLAVLKNATLGAGAPGMSVIDAATLGSLALLLCHQQPIFWLHPSTGRVTRDLNVAAEVCKPLDKVNTLSANKHIADGCAQEAIKGLDLGFYPGHSDSLLSLSSAPIKASIDSMKITASSAKSSSVNLSSPTDAP